MRRPAGPDQPAGLPGPAGRHLPVAEPDPSDPRDRDNGYDVSRLLRRRSAAGQPRRLRRARAAGPASEASGSSSTWSSTTPPTSTRGSGPPARTRIRRTATGTSGAPTEPPDRRQGMVFPGEQTETWTFDKQAGAWYFHRFYDFQPDLNWSNPDGSRARSADHGLLAAAGCVRVPDRRRSVRPGAGAAGRRPGPMDCTILDDWREDRRNGDAATPCCSARPTWTAAR